MAGVADTPLRGRRVLVTRPDGLADHLAELIREAGGEALCVPALRIEPPGDPGLARSALQSAADCQAVIFISRNAVRHAEALLPEFFTALPGLKVYAAGPGTRAELVDRGIDATSPPASRSGAAGVLELPEMAAEQVQDRALMIVRGEGGREHLRAELERRGARVRYAEVYRRAGAEPETGAVDGIWRDKTPDVIVVSSMLGLERLVDMTDREFHGALFATPVVAISARIADGAVALGFRGPRAVARGASDEGLVAAAESLFREAS